MTLCFIIKTDLPLNFSKFFNVTKIYYVFYSFLNSAPDLSLEVTKSIITKQ